jgi:hypothetical protein
VCALSLLFLSVIAASFSLSSHVSQSDPVISGLYRGTPFDRSWKALRTCIPRKSSTGISSPPTSSSRARA